MHRAFAPVAVLPDFTNDSHSQDLVEIEEWNEYGELKQHVTLYYDEFTQPSIHQKPKQPPATAPKAPPAPAPKTTIEKAAAAAAAGAAAAAAAAGGATSGSKTTSKTTSKTPSTAPKTTLPVRSIAEEAAAKAKQVHLQSLREKVYGKGNTSPSSPTDPTKSPTAAAATTPTDKSTPATTITTTDTSSTTGSAAGLQSPTSSGWKPPAAPPTTQSPTSTSWKPRDVDPPVTNLHGAAVANASAEEIVAVEQAQTIKEEPGKEGGKADEEEEESEEDDDDDDDDEEDESDDEEENKKPAAAKPKAGDATKGKAK